jgi:hypothetical protein
MILLAFLISVAHATEPNLQPGEGMKEKSAFEQALEKNADYPTNERWVQYGDTRYREVEYHGQKYFVKFTGRAGDFGELDCDLPSGNLNPHLSETGTEVFHRTKMFVDFIQETCARDATGQKRASVRLDPRLGFTIPDGKNSVIKNKKVFVGPRGLGFSGDW